MLVYGMGCYYTGLNVMGCYCTACGVNVPDGVLVYAMEWSYTALDVSIHDGVLVFGILF